MEVGVVDAAETRELRRAVLRPTLLPGDPLPGDDRPDAVHLGARDPDGTVVSTCIVFPEPCPWLPGSAAAWHLRQMATAPQRRGEGAGSLVLAAALALVAARGAPLVWCHARAQAEPFYARAGFRAVGELFADGEPPIPHRRMYREPPAGPTSS